MKYEPTTEVLEILHTLRSHRLGWISDEIETAIGVGKLVEKDIYVGKSKSKIKAAESSPYLPEEQEGILLSAIYHYFSGLYEMNQQVSAFSIKTKSGLEIHGTKILPEVGDTPLRFFEDRFDPTALVSILKMAWPTGESDFRP